MEKLPHITKENLDDATLDDWQEEFWGVYHRQDRDRNLHQVWSMAYEDATKVGEAIREGNPQGCLNALAHTFCWIASFVAKVGKDESVYPRFQRIKEFNKLSSVVWFKYPKTCPSCLNPNCICLILKKKFGPDEVESVLAKKRISEKPPTIMDDWDTMFARIYDKAHLLRSLSELGFHLLEEMGEVEEVIRKIATWTKNSKDPLRKLRKDLVLEVADTVSWCFSIVRKIAADAEKYEAVEEGYRAESDPSFNKEGFTTSRLTLSKVLWAEYCPKGRNEIWCPTCWKKAKGKVGRPCKCEIGEWMLKDPRFNPSR
jgi:NTP pyrophosphatase (non-canonical NTP hydrolase)